MVEFLVKAQKCQHIHTGKLDGYAAALVLELYSK